MKLNVINNNHGKDSKAWYTLGPLQKYHQAQGIPTMWGLATGNYARAIEYKNTNKPWLFCDMPYWGRWNPLKQAVNPQAEYFWRVCFEDIHVTKIFPNLPRDRIEHINIKPWRKNTGDYILVAPSSVTINSYIGQRDWEQLTVEWLRTQTDMPIKVRHKPRKNGKSGPAYALVPLEEDLKYANCVVTSCSMVSIDAIIEGIPVYCHASCPAFPVSQPLEKFGTPMYPNNRDDWLATLSWHQYTQEEIESGLFKDMFERMYDALR
jgi:hypothetical protein|tara:strand:+ start:129 stop:920 length:792 start_codon:yes stop_codon:yes gene_type:complete